jgi:putative membrane protein
VKFILKFAILTIALSLFVMYYNNGQFITMTNPNDYKTIATFLGVLVLLNIFVKPILKILTLPLNCLTFGLFSFVINFIVVYLADQMILSFAFTSLTYTFLFSITFALMNSVLDYFLKDND